MLSRHLIALPPHAGQAGRNLDLRGKGGHSASFLDRAVQGIHGGDVCNHERDTTGNTYVMQVSAEITDVNTIAERLKAAREDAELTQEQLAFRAGVSQSTIGNVEASIRQNPRELLAIAAALQVMPQWLKTGRGPRHATPSSAGVAQEVSPAPYTLPLRMTWEAVMQADELPERFVLPMPDAALDPKITKGTDLIFDRAAAPAPGVGVLVQDRSGRRYIRRYAEGLGGAWSAQVVNDTYPALESDRDGLQLLAVMTGRLDGTI